MNRRALLLILDGVGVGDAPDAARFGDQGADTLGHVLDAMNVDLPALWSLGLGHVVGRGPASRIARHGRLTAEARGKDSTTGHWELAGAVSEEPFATFERFPSALVAPIEAESGVSFIGNKAASGTAIIEELGPEHMAAGRPILYTSADSVLQIAAHEAVLPVERLYEVCRIARRHADRWRIGRVIARPFVGEPGSFVRTEGRHDFSMDPPRNVLDALSEAGVPVRGVGKVADLFTGRGFSESHPTRGNREGMHATAELWRDGTGGVVFTNLVDFDTLYGHRRDIAGFAEALRRCDEWLGEFVAGVDRDDLVLITADHGNDPTFRGTDHTREQTPLLLLHGARTGSVGKRAFADVAATLAEFFEVGPWSTGRSLLGAALESPSPERAASARP